MKELSLNILDIAKNSVKAGASLITITIDEADSWRVLTIADNGCGMSPEFLAAVTDPFTTTRTTRPASGWTIWTVSLWATMPAPWSP